MPMLVVFDFRLSTFIFIFHAKSSNNDNSSKQIPPRDRHGLMSRGRKTPRRFEAAGEYCAYIMSPTCLCQKKR